MMLVRCSLNSQQTLIYHRSLLQSICSFRAVVSAAVSSDTNADVSDTSKSTEEWENARPFQEIPGPSTFQLIARYMPYGKYFKKDLFDVHKLLKKFGDLVKFPGIFGRKPIVMTFDQHNIEKLFRTEGLIPVRNGIDCSNYYRMEYRKDYFRGDGGLIINQGEVWASRRSKVNPIMLMLKTVKKYTPCVDTVALDFIARMREYQDKNNEMPADFGQELNKWDLESIGTIALDTRLGCLDDKANPEVERFINYVRRFFELAFELDVQLSIWKIYKTKMFYELMDVFDGINDYVSHYVDKTVNYLNEKEQKASDHEESIIQKLLKIDRQTAIIMEALRLNPVTPGNLRAAGQDIVLSGYRIPKGMDVATGNIVLGWDDNNFEDWKKFIPERWLKNAKESECPVKTTKSLHPFVFLPFGHGPRTCIGRRFAELEVEVMMLRLLREFKIEWKYGPLNYRVIIVNFPCNDLKFTVIDLDK